MFGCLLRWYRPTIYLFGGSCPVPEFCQLQNSLCVQVFRSPILAALLHGTRAVGVSQSVRRGTRNGIAELLQRAPPIFGSFAEYRWRPSRWASAHILVFFFSRILSGRRLECLPYFHTWCGLSANLECRSEMCCTRLAENTGRKKSQSAHHRTTLLGYIFATIKHVSTIGKLLNSNIGLPIWPNMVSVREAFYYGRPM